MRELDYSAYYEVFNGKANGYEVSELLWFYGQSNKYNSNLSCTLTRNHKKGDGLYQKLMEIKTKGETPRYFSKAEREKQREKEQAAKAANWREQGRCQYCGGELKGLLGKKCVNCGKPKDY